MKLGVLIVCLPALAWAVPQGQQDDDSEVAPLRGKSSLSGEKDDGIVKPKPTEQSVGDGHNNEQPTETSVDDRKPGRRNDRDRLTLNAGGTYAGVKLEGKGDLPPNVPPKPPGGPPQLTWSGFQLEAGVPTVFLQLSGVPNYSVTETPSAVVVLLKNTSVHRRNNRRPLRLEAFETSVRSVETKARGKDLVVTIKTAKPNSAHKERVQAGASGYQMLLIQIPTS